MGHREALYYVKTGETFTGVQAAQMGLINKSVPKVLLRETVIALANTLLEKNPVVLRDAKQGFKRARELTWEQGEDYLYAKTDQSNYRTPEQGRKQGLQQVPGRQDHQAGPADLQAQLNCPNDHNNNDSSGSRASPLRGLHHIQSTEETSDVSYRFAQRREIARRFQ